MIAVSEGSIKTRIRGAAKHTTPRLTHRENTADVKNALRTPRRMRSVFPAPKFCATKVENALPKSCTGMYANASIFTAAANAAITAASDSLGSVSLTGYEIVKLVKASRACSEMALSAFESYIVEVIAEAVARRIEKYIFTGTGTNQPGGVKTAGKGASGAYTDGTDQITVGKTASLTEENVIALYGLLGDGYERNAVWCMNKATFFSDFFPLMNKSKNNVIEFANGKYYIMGAEVYFTGSLAAHEAYLGDFSYIIGNYSQDITVVRSEHSGLATNSIDYLGACVFDSKPVAGFGAFVHLAKAAA